MFLHQTRGNPRFLSNLTKFDLKLTPRGDRKPNFDQIVRMSWNQCHGKDYSIPFPMTAHGSKSKLKRLRYLENHARHVCSFPDSITFDPTG